MRRQSADIFPGGRRQFCYFGGSVSRRRGGRALSYHKNRTMLRKALVALLAASFADQAFAYIDPNTGGWLYQMLFPLLIAIAGAWAVLRQKVAEYLSTLAAKFRRKPR